MRRALLILLLGYSTATAQVVDTIKSLPYPAWASWDTEISETSPTANNERATTLTVDATTGQSIIIGVNVDTLIATVGENTIDYLELWIWCTVANGAYVAAYEMDKASAMEGFGYVNEDWVPSEHDEHTTYDYWIKSNYFSFDTAWGVAGAESTCTDGAQNRGDGVGCDRELEAFDTILVSTTGWKIFTIPRELVSSWIAGTKECYGIMLAEFDNTGVQYTSTFRSHDNLNQSSVWWVTHSNSGGPSSTPCSTDMDSCYTQAYRAAYVPDFEVPPDTVRAVFIWAGRDSADVSFEGWTARDSMFNDWVDTVNRILGDSVNVYIAATLSRGYDSRWGDGQMDMDYITYSPDTKAYVALNGIEPTKQMQVFIGPSAYVAAGYTSVQGWPVASLLTFSAFDEDYASGASILHEICHFFGLVHTHQGISYNEGNFVYGQGYDFACDEPCREWPQTYDTIPDSVFYVVGDHCPDVPVDPTFSHSTGLPVVANDTLCTDSSFGLTHMTNVMSYGPDSCRVALTGDQATIFRAFMLTYFDAFVVGD